MRNIIGSPVRGEDFLERTVETQALWSRVDGNSVLLLAPRRVGKTSLLCHMADHPRPGWSCLFVSVESVETEAQLVSHLLEKVRGCMASKPVGGVGRALRGLWSRTKKIGPVELESPPAKEWRETGEELRRELARLDGPMLILMDELPIFVRHLLGAPDGVRRVRLFMDWFRALRHDPEIGHGTIRFVLSGSLELDTVVAKMNMTATINDLESFHLGPLTDQLAEELLVRLAVGANLALTKELRDKIISLIGWPIPYHVQLIFGQVRDQAQFHHKLLDDKLITSAYRTLLSSKSLSYFRHWVERLGDSVLDLEERKLAFEVLRAAARDAKGVRVDTIRSLRRRFAPGLDESLLLKSLERDGYLVEQDGRYFFPSALLRDWWVRWVSGKNGSRIGVAHDL